MSRARFLLAGLGQLLIGVAAVQAALVLFRFVIHPPLVATLGLDAPAESLTRRIGAFVAAIASYWAVVHWQERRPVRELLVDWRWTLAGAAGGAASIAVPILVLYATGHYQITAVRGLDGGVASMLFVILVAATIEEVTFRGLLFRILEERTGTRTALAASSLAFSVAHYASNGFTPITLMAVVLTGAMWSCVYVVSRNLWVAAAHHCCWNATIFLTGLPLSGQEEWRQQAPLVSSYSGSELWSGGAFGPENSLLAIGLSAMLCLALWRWARASAAIVAPPRPGVG